MTGKGFPRLGAHMSIAGGFEKSIERGLKVGCQTVQIFSKSNNQWEAPPIAPETAGRFRKAMRESGIGPIFAHTAYLINVGSPEKETHDRSRQALKVEVERATALGLAFIVLHPGSHKNRRPTNKEDEIGGGRIRRARDNEPTFGEASRVGEAGPVSAPEELENSCIERIAKTVAEVIRQTNGSPVKVLYEIAAGQGSAVGYRFEHLAGLLKLTGHPDRTGICLDTCHLFAAGYDFRTPAGYEKMTAEFDRLVGLNRVEAIHLNDSKKELGARVDRHEHIGQGQIGLEGFRSLLNDSRLNRVPMVLETPKDEKTLAEDVMNLRVLRSLKRGQAPLGSKGTRSKGLPV